RDFHVTGVQTCALPIYHQLKGLLLTTMQSGELVAEDLIAATETVREAQEALGKVNFQFFSAASLERIGAANRQFTETVEQAIPALMQAETAEDRKSGV